MKIKVKGLVFVGFAAAIMSASAMADPSGTTITSLAYTESTYQKKDNIQTSFTSANENSTTQYPSMGAVTAKITSAMSGIQTYSQGTGISIDNGVISNSGVTSVTASNATTGTNGTISVSTAGGDAVEVAVKGLKSAAYVDTTTDTTLAGTGNTGKLPTAATVKTYADTKQTQSNATSGTYKVGHTGTSWATLGAEGYVTIDNTTAASPKIKLDATNKINNSGSVASNATSSNDKLITEYTLSNTINGINNTINSLPSSSIPGKSSICTAALPCALVAETTGFHWRVMAVSANQATQAGTLADFCDANTSCTLGTCNTTGGANVCVESN